MRGRAGCNQQAFKHRGPVSAINTYTGSLKDGHDWPAFLESLARAIPEDQTLIIDEDGARDFVVTTTPLVADMIRRRKEVRRFRCLKVATVKQGDGP